LDYSPGDPTLLLAAIREEEEITYRPMNARYSGLLIFTADFFRCQNDRKVGKDYSQI
jgi:hypothetical protein